jgi:hypothetical protein
MQKIIFVTYLLIKFFRNNLNLTMYEFFNEISRFEVKKSNDL